MDSASSRGRTPAPYTPHLEYQEKYIYIYKYEYTFVYENTSSSPTCILPVREAALPCPLRLT